MAAPTDSGDFSFGGRHWRLYVPLGTSILLSILLTLILWLIQYFRRWSSPDCHFASRGMPL